MQVYYVYLLLKFYIFEDCRFKAHAETFSSPNHSPCSLFPSFLWPIIKGKKKKNEKKQQIKKNEFILSFWFYVSVIVTLCTCLYSVDCLMAKVFRSLVEMKYDYNGKIKRLRFLPVFLRICLLYTFFPPVNSIL